MKHYIFLLTSLALCLFFTKSTLGQATDTLVIIVDKDFERVEFRKELRLYEFNTFIVAIESRYYGEDRMDHVHTVLEEVLEDWGGRVKVTQPKLKLHKQDLKKYKIFTDKWISEQDSLHVLDRHIVGLDLNRKTAYVVFKDELDCGQQDSVTLHQVLVGFDQIAD